MSGSFAGSKSVDDRRRRRLAADDTQTKSTVAVTGATSPEKPLPSRRPTGRFPLRRIVSRSYGKLTAVAFAALFLAVATVAAGYWPDAAGGTYGPGVASFVDTGQGRLPQTAAGVLLLVAGQLAWLIRWARARSMRDFRGRYRVWRWVSLALTVAGLAQLCDAPQAFSASAVWLTGQQPLGSDIVFRLLPAVCAILVLLPSLQGDMRDCRTSRSLLLIAAMLWLASSAGSLFPAAATMIVSHATVPVPAAAVVTGLFLTSIAAVFGSLLFHARHVVYESVEPPNVPLRRKRAAKATAAADATTDTDEAPAKRASRRSRTTKASKTTTPAEKKTVDPPAAKAEPPATATKPAAVAPAKPAASTAPSKTPAPAPAAPKPAAEPVRGNAAVSEDDWADEDAQATGKNGNHYRLDGAEDSLKGMSKRERRKQRKAARDRERSEF